MTAKTKNTELLMECVSKPNRNEMQNERAYGARKNPRCNYMYSTQVGLNGETSEHSNRRFIIMNAEIQDSQFLLVNLYAPNTVKEQLDFFSEIKHHIEEFNVDPDNNIIIGGDFNATFKADLDCSGGKPSIKESVKKIQEIESEYDLIDIWRIRNPESKLFTWRQKRPLIQRRLDFWLISDNLQDEVCKANIIPSIKSDHSAITLSLESEKKNRNASPFTQKTVD